MPTYHGANTTIRLRVWDPSKPWTSGYKLVPAEEEKCLEARIAMIRASRLQPVDHGPAKGFVFEDIAEEWVWSCRYIPNGQALIWKLQVLRRLSEAPISRCHYALLPCPSRKRSILGLTGRIYLQRFLQLKHSLEFPVLSFIRGRRPRCWKCIDHKSYP